MKGRKKSLDQTLKNTAIFLAKNHGFTDEQISKSLGVCEATLNNTKLYDKEFSRVLKEAKEEFNIQLIESSLLSRAKGMIVRERKIETKPDGQKIITEYERELAPDTNAISLYLRNRSPEQWCRDKTNIEVTPKIQQGLTRVEAIEILKNDPFLEDIN